MNRLDTWIARLLTLGNVLVAASLVVAFLGAMLKIVIGVSFMSPLVEQLLARAFALGVILAVPCAVLWHVRNGDKDVT